MLPYSTERRTPRNMIKPDGRTVEIQRPIGRIFRGMIDLSKIKGHSVMIDSDVLQADGGTRTAANTGAAISLAMAVKRMQAEGRISEDPLMGSVVAVSVGYVKGELVMDLGFCP